MASPQRDVIDFSALERELRASVESERKRQRENDAKLRAVAQKTSSYQEFRYVPGPFKDLQDLFQDLFQDLQDLFQPWSGCMIPGLVLVLQGPGAGESPDASGEEPKRRVAPKTALEPAGRPGNQKHMTSDLSFTI